jgi:hypothetical protein
MCMFPAAAAVTPTPVSRRLHVVCVCVTISSCLNDHTILSSCGCRMSLSWSRILPGGGRGTAPNAAALRFYSTLLQQLLSAGITPVVTLYHLDLPQALQVRMYCESTHAAAAGPSWFPQRQPYGGRSVKIEMQGVQDLCPDSCTQQLAKTAAAPDDAVAYRKAHMATPDRALSPAQHGEGMYAW